MKKICIYILLLSSLYIGCFHNLVGTFMSAHADHSTMSMQMHSDAGHGHHEMMSHSTWQNDCEEQAHECCISPYTDSQTPLGSQNVNSSSEENDSNSDIDNLAIYHSNAFINCIEKLNSPPPDISWWEQPVYLKTQYSALVWIIRNNA